MVRKSVWHGLTLLVMVAGVNQDISLANAQVSAPPAPVPATPKPAISTPAPAPAANLRKFPPAVMGDVTVRLTLANVDAELRPEGRRRELFVTAFREYEQELAAWETANGERYTNLCVQLERAAQNLDTTRLQQVSEELTHLAQERAQLIGAHRIKIHGLMDEMQKIRWLTYKVRLGSLNKLRVVKLTPAQEQRIGEIARAVIEENRRDPRFFETGADLTMQFVNAVVVEAKRKLLDEKQKLVLDPPAPVSAPAPTSAPTPAPAPTPKP